MKIVQFLLIIYDIRYDKIFRKLSFLQRQKILLLSKAV